MQNRQPYLFLIDSHSLLSAAEVAKPEVCDKPSVCDENADKVEQTFSEYKCVCKEGFEGDGITCEGRFNFVYRLISSTNHTVLQWFCQKKCFIL